MDYLYNNCINLMVDTKGQKHPDHLFQHGFTKRSLLLIKAYLLTSGLY